jgi:hypothetical protein
MGYPWTLEATLIGEFGNSALDMQGLEWVSSTGTLYGMSSHDAGLYSISTTTGHATLIGLTGLSSVCNIAWDGGTDTLFMTNSGTNSFYSINRSTGAASLIGGLNGPTDPAALAWTDYGMLLADNGTDSLYRINLGNGAATLIGPMGVDNVLGLAQIPEPSTFAVLTFGGLTLIVRRRR